MKSTRSIIFFILFLLASPANSQNYGEYIGKVQTEWLDDGRRMKLLSSLTYISPAGEKWEAPSGWVVDGASIPQFTWTFIGGPFEGKYRNASVIHDVGCDRKVRPWEKVHEVFYYAMLASDVSSYKAKVMYAAVYYFGPRWPKVVTVYNLPRTQTPIAKNKALEGTIPGSRAEIINIKRRSLFGERADFKVKVIPPQSNITYEEFDQLKQTIKDYDKMDPAAFDLRKIREYKTKQSQ